MLHDIDGLYRAHAPGLRRFVAGDEHADVEDACQLAWLRLIDHRERVRPDCVFAWLVSTARREASREHAGGRLQSLEALVEAGGDGAFPTDARGPHELVEDRERLASLAVLPDRQRRLVWLRGAGFSYEELAVREACTVRTAERQLLKARRAIRALAAAA